MGPLAAGVFLAGCAGFNADTPAPHHTTSGVVVPTSADQQALMAYYAGYQKNALARGLMRTDGGHDDMPTDMNVIIQHFERVALYDEYVPGAGYQKSRTQSTLAKWHVPIVYHVFYGNSVTTDLQRQSALEIDGFWRQLSDLTGHSIRSGPANRANFSVILAGTDDQSDVLDYVASQLPNAHDQAHEIIKTMPRDVHCLVMALSNGLDRSYSKAIAVIRAEHPAQQRLACIHEELAQGLGLAADDDTVRPSIFNDDDEFATLTAMDQVMLKILYDPRLKSGMTLDQARPILTQIGDDLSRPHS